MHNANVFKQGLNFCLLKYMIWYLNILFKMQIFIYFFVVLLLQSAMQVLETSLIACYDWLLAPAK